MSQGPLRVAVAGLGLAGAGVAYGSYAVISGRGAQPLLVAAPVGGGLLMAVGGGATQLACNGRSLRLLPTHNGLALHGRF